MVTVYWSHCFSEFLSGGLDFTYEVCWVLHRCIFATQSSGEAEHLTGPVPGPESLLTWFLVIIGPWLWKVASLNSDVLPSDQCFSMLCVCMNHICQIEKWLLPSCPVFTSLIQIFCCCCSAFKKWQRLDMGTAGSMLCKDIWISKLALMLGCWRVSPFFSPLLCRGSAVAF